MWREVYEGQKNRMNNNRNNNNNNNNKSNNNYTIPRRRHRRLHRQLPLLSIAILSCQNSTKRGPKTPISPALFGQRTYRNRFPDQPQPPVAPDGGWRLFVVLVGDQQEQQQTIIMVVRTAYPNDWLGPCICCCLPTVLTCIYCTIGLKHFPY